MRPIVSLLSLALAAVPALAQDAGYLLPPPEVVEILDAAPAPTVDLSPDGQWALLIERPAMPSIEEVARPMERLAGMRIDPVARARYVTGYSSGLVLRKVGAPVDGSRDVRVPVKGKLSRVMWAPDSRHFAFTTVDGEAHNLFWTHVDDPTRQDQVADRLNTLFISPRFVAGGRGMLYAVTAPDHLGEPELAAMPLAPAVQETGGETTPTRTYQDLLESPRDVALFDHYATTYVVVDLYTHREEPLREAPGTNYAVDEAYGYRSYAVTDDGLWTGASLSPDMRWVLKTRLDKPYSYLLPSRSFPTVTEAELFWGHPEFAGRTDFSGPEWDVVLIEKKPLDQNIPIGGVRTGRRSIQWYQDAPATLVWVSALDGGDPDAEVPARDAWYAQDAPFTTAPRELFRTEHRAWGMSYTEQPGLVIAGEYDRDRRWTRSFLVDLDAEGGPAMGLVLEDRATSDAYGDPGDPLRVTDTHGVSRARIDAWASAEGTPHRFMYRSGSGASPEGVLPFLDRLDLDTGATERLWRCTPGTYETVTMLLDERSERMAGTLGFITRFETKTTPPNHRLRTFDGETSEVAADLTAFPDPTPAMRAVHKELVTYEREDGVPLSATLYLPADYEEGAELPLLVWAYPREYNDAGTAGQVTASDARFTRVAGLSHLVLLTQGYAILDGATMPIVGDPETMNDHFIEQIVTSAAAAIDYAVGRGVADRDKVVVGGHSYGAFMTANLLAHSDLFATGIARSGAYNRTLTPFGFQSERRTFWEAPEAYFAVSPFMHAHKIDEPLLMIHGMIDNNSGTFPMQSERLFQAIKGNGGTARLVMLPAESHGYRARESVLHAQAETIAWLKRFVK